MVETFKIPSSCFLILTIYYYLHYLFIIAAALQCNSASEFSAPSNCYLVPVGLPVPMHPHYSPQPLAITTLPSTSMVEAA